MFLRPELDVANENDLLRNVMISHVINMDVDVCSSSSNENYLCLACGGGTCKGSRAPAVSVASLLKRFLSQRCQEMEIDVDVDDLLINSWVCRSCAKVYKTHQQKDERLYAATSNSVSLQQATCTISSDTPRTRKRSQSSQDLSVQPITKKVCTSSPPVTVNIDYNSGLKKYPQNTPRRKKFVRLFSRQASPKTIVKEVLKDKQLLLYLVNGIAQLLKREMKLLCSDRTDSILRSCKRNHIIKFPWSQILDEVKENCPLLLSFLTSLTNTSTPRSNRSHLVVTIVCILAKHHCSIMSLFQKLISSILYAGHCGTVVYTRLQKLSLCLSKTGLYSLQHLLGTDFDEDVITWMTSLLPKSPSTTVEQDNIISDNLDEAILSDDECNVVIDDDIWNNEASDENEYFDCNNLPDNNLENCETAITLCETSVNESEEPAPNSECETPSFSNLSDNTNISAIDLNSSHHSSPWNGFKIVGDNLDINVRPRFKRVDNATVSLHFFQSYAVRDRIDLSDASEDKNPYLNKPVSDLPVDILLPSVSDDVALTSNLSILISRVLIKVLPYFSQTFEGVVSNHIRHDYTEQMSQKSKTVPLGVILKNENVLEDMIDILHQIHRYVPVTECTIKDPVTQKIVRVDPLHEILFGGDQLTRKRAQTAKESSKNNVTPSDRLEGVIPVCEDWHGKKIFLEMMWTWLYSTKSFLDEGTLCHLRNLIDRRNISAAASDDFNSCEDFFVTVVHCHIIAASMDHFKMNDVLDEPNHSLLYSDLWTESEDKRKEALDTVVKEIVLSYVDILVHNELDEEIKEDKVKCYATEVLSLGLLYLEFQDSVKEGDGDRILRCWRYLMLIFKARKRKNYSIEAINLLSQYHFFLTQRQSMQLLWSRTVNTHGIIGRNIPCDLMMEHFNRVCKEAVLTLGSNKTMKAIERVGRCVGSIDALLEEYDEEVCLHERSGRHSVASDEKDRRLIIEALTKAKVFSFEKGRSHSVFKDVKVNIIQSIYHDKKIDKWLRKHLQALKNSMF